MYLRATIKLVSVGVGVRIRVLVAEGRGDIEATVAYWGEIGIIENKM